MNNAIFSTENYQGVRSSTYDMGHDHITTCDMGKIIPLLNEEVLPGDKWSIKPNIMVRLRPMIYPIHATIKVRTNSFYVPHRILWDDWDEWITEDLDEAIIPPHMNDVEITESSLGHYMGLPIDSLSPDLVLPYKVAGYYLIYDEYYRAQDIIAEKSAKVSAGQNDDYQDLIDASPLRCAWDHDVFTSCLLWAQKGDPITLPLLKNDTAPVTFKEAVGGGIITQKDFDGADITNDGQRIVGRDLEDVLGGTVGVQMRDFSTGIDHDASLLTGTAGVNPFYVDPQVYEVAINAEAATVAALRTAFALQTHAERKARSGTRYPEWLKVFWNIQSDDARFQRPEYLGSTTQYITIGEVLSQTQTLDSMDVPTTPVGDYAGHGISVSGNSRINYFAKEHGTIYTLLTIVPETLYSQGIHKSWTRLDQYDHALSDFAHIGEEPVLIKEIYTLGMTPADKNEIFGYNQRFISYKHLHSKVTGEMDVSLQFAHMSRYFTAKPQLTEQFIECNPPTDMFAVTSGAHTCRVHCAFQITCSRQLPRVGIPKLA